MRFRKSFYRILVIILISVYFFVYTLFNKRIESEARRSRIFCMILTQEKNLNTKARAVNQTWAKECDKYFFILRFNSSDSSKTLESYDPLPILQPADYAQESYQKLTDKVFRTYKHVHHAYSDYDWYLKADDDTYVFMDNLRDFLSDKDASKAASYGNHWDILFKGGYDSGGAGYVLSSAAMRRLGGTLAQNYTYCLNTGLEDIDTGRCLRQMNIMSGETRDKFNRRRFHAFSIKEEFDRHRNSSFGEAPISFHYTKPAEMYTLHNLFEIYKTESLKTPIPLNFTSILLTIL